MAPRRADDWHIPIPSARVVVGYTSDVYTYIVWNTPAMRKRNKVRTIYHASHKLDCHGYLSPHVMISMMNRVMSSPGSSAAAAHRIST